MEPDSVVPECWGEKSIETQRNRSGPEAQHSVTALYGHEWLPEEAGHGCLLEVVG